MSRQHQKNFLFNQKIRTILAQINASRGMVLAQSLEDNNSSTSNCILLTLDALSDVWSFHRSSHNLAHDRCAASSVCRPYQQPSCSHHLDNQGKYRRFFEVDGCPSRSTSNGEEFKYTFFFISKWFSQGSGLILAKKLSKLLSKNQP